jgi:hypothetical protein
MNIGLGELAVVLAILAVVAVGVAVIVLGGTAASKDPKPPRQGGERS